MKRDKKRIGWVDYCRVNDAGKVTCTDVETLKPAQKAMRILPAEDTDESKQKAKTLKAKLEKRKKVVGPINRNVGTQNWAKAGSPLLTATSKVHTPTWSMPMGATCPSVKGPLASLLKEMVEGGQRDPIKIVREIFNKVPQKCLACYAMGGNYIYPETQAAMGRRLTWFDTTNDKEVEDTIVDAIKHGGNEKCNKRTGVCKFIPGVQPEYFRAFDSGDFHNARAAKIWEKVVKRLPTVKFWFPTTAWTEPCDPAMKDDHKELMATLKRMAAEPHVIIRPSAHNIDEPAPAFEGFAQGTSVVEQSTADAGLIYYKDKDGKDDPTRPSKTTSICRTDDQGNKTDCKVHHICPGNCGLCQRCWKKNDPVVYVRHGMKAEATNLVKIVNKTLGLHLPTPLTYDQALADAERLSTSEKASPESRAKATKKLNKLRAPGGAEKHEKDRQQSIIKYRRANQHIQDAFRRLFEHTWAGPTEVMKPIERKAKKELKQRLEQQ